MAGGWECFLPRLRKSGPTDFLLWEVTTTTNAPTRWGLVRTFHWRSPRVGQRQVFPCRSSRFLLPGIYGADNFGAVPTSTNPIYPCLPLHDIYDIEQLLPLLAHLTDEVMNCPRPLAVTRSEVVSVLVAGVPDTCFSRGAARGAFLRGQWNDHPVTGPRLAVWADHLRTFSR